MSESLSLFPETELWEPFSALGLSGPFFSLNWEVLVNTWIALGVVLAIALFGRWAIRRPDKPLGYTILTALKSLVSLVTSSEGFHARHFFFVGALFVYILVCNLLVLCPGLEEPTKDLSTTFALAILSVFYAQKEGISAHGLIGWANEIFKTPLTLFPNGFRLIDVPFAMVKFILNICFGLFSMPMELLSKFANIMSLSFRLFGNIFGGSVIIGIVRSLALNSLVLQLITICTGLNLIVILFFGVFEGLIQAFVFSMLSVTYISMATQKGDDHGH